MGIRPIAIANATPDGEVISRYGPYENIWSKYENDPLLNDLYATDGPRSFNSMQRLKLLSAALSMEKRFGGAELSVEKRVKQGKLLAVLAMHDCAERNALRDAFVRAPRVVGVRASLPYVRDLSRATGPPSGRSCRSFVQVACPLL